VIESKIGSGMDILHKRFEAVSKFMAGVEIRFNDLEKFKVE
jgi:hypothetical protein